METARQRTAQQSRKDAILVMGMHRSGTSLLAGILDRLGCKGPKNPIEANDRNPKGYFESQPIFRLNDEILAAAGTRWNDWQPLREGWHASPRFTEFRARAADLVRAEYGDASMIYLKDPRICRILPLWRDVFEDMGYRVACILTHRHPLDVAASLKARQTIEVEPSLGMLSWLRHVLDAEAASRDVPRIFTSYSSLVTGWQGLADRAEQALGFTWPAMTRTARERVAELIDPGLRHHGASVDAFLDDPLVPEPFRETLRVLERWVQDGENAEDRAILDRLRRDFDQSAPLLHAPLAALETATREIRALVQHKAETEAGKAEIDALATRLAEAENQRDQASARETRLTTELIQSHAMVEDAHAAAEARQAEIDALATRLAEAEGQRIQALSQVEQMREELEQTRRSAEATQAENDALASRLVEAELREAELSTEVETWADRLIERDKKIFALQRESDRKRHDSTATKAELDTLSARLSKAEGERGRAVEQEKALRKELEQARKAADQARVARQAELDTLSARISKAEGERGRAVEQEKALRKELEQARKAADQARVARQTELDSLTAKLSEATRIASQNARLRLDLEQSQNASKARQVKLSNKVNRLAAQLRDMKIVHLRAISDLHDSYRTSTSWKLSAPVRAAGKLVRGRG